MLISYSIYCLVTLVFCSTDCTPFSVISGTIHRWELIASKIIQRYIASIYDIHIICETACVTNEFLKTMPVPVYLSQHRVLPNSIVFLLSQSCSFFTEVLNTTANSTDSKYVVFLDYGGCIALPWALEQFWNHKLLNVVVIPLRENTTPIYTYLPFKERSCFDPSPVLIDNFTDAFVDKVVLFPEKKVWNLHRCTLKVSTFMFSVLQIESGKVTGLLAPVFYAVVDAMNFSPELIHTKGKGMYGFASGPNKTGLRGDVYTGQAHLGFQFLSPIDFEYLDYDSLALTSCLTWCLTASYKTMSPWWMVFGEFAPAVWVMLFLSGIATIATDKLSQRVDHHREIIQNDDMFLIVIGAFLQASGKDPQYSSWHLRIVWLFWSTSSLVLSTVYLSTLQSFRAAPNIGYSVNNLEELADAGYQAWYAKAYTPLVEDARENPVVARLLSNSIAYPPITAGGVSKFWQRKDIALLMADKECRFMSTLAKAELYPLSHDCMQVTPFHFLVMERKSVFTNAVRILMGRLTQAGIVQKSLSKVDNISKNTDTKQRPLTVGNMRSVFLLLLCGLSISLVVLLMECLFGRNVKGFNTERKRSDVYLKPPAVN